MHTPECVRTKYWCRPPNMQKETHKIHTCLKTFGQSFTYLCCTNTKLGAYLWEPKALIVVCNRL